MDETKIIYYVDDEETPYLLRFQSGAEQVTLGDFKAALNRPNYKYFFRSLDDDFGVVKEEITEEDVRLPCVNGRVVSWLVCAEGSTQSDNQSSSGKEAVSGIADVETRERSDSSDGNKALVTTQQRQVSLGSRQMTRSEEYKASHKTELPRTKHKFIGPEKINIDETDDTFDEIDSIYNGDKVPPLRRFSEYKHGSKVKKTRSAGSHNTGTTVNSVTNGSNNSSKQQPIYESSSSMMSSDLDTTSFFDSEDESSRFSSCTETTMSSKYGRQKRQMRRRRKMPHLSRASSFSSMTDSTVSLNIITVTLNMDTVPFLGISIVGQTNGNGENGDGGIYVGSIMKGGAVALDGRIEPGDMILEVNGISFENVSNEEAVRTLREQVQKPGPVTLVVAKSWDSNPAGYMLPQPDPVRPIDPRAWVLHTQAMGNLPPQLPVSGIGDQFNQSGNYLPYVGAMSTVASTVTTNSSSLKSSSVVETQNQQNKNYVSRIDDNIPSPLLSNHDPSIIVRAMSLPDSGLSVRDRLWLKITIYNAFIGSDLVDWLYTHVEGFSDRKDARKYAINLLKNGHIKHTVNKNTFSEQCYYVFNELHTAMSCLNLESEIDSVSVVAGQQSKSRLMHQDQGSKESPVLSSGFQSGCSNKWSNFNVQSAVIPGDMILPGSYQGVMYPINNNNYKHQPFYSENMQQVPQSQIVKQHPSMNLAPSSNLKSTRPPGSVHSGSDVNYCVCLQPMSMIKAMKHMWESTNKSLLSTENNGSGGVSHTELKQFEDSSKNSSIQSDDQNSLGSVATCRLCGGDQNKRDLSSNNGDLELISENSGRHNSYHVSKDDTPHTSGSSASGSSSNMTRNMAVYHIQNQQPPGGIMSDSNQHCPYSGAPPSYQQSITQILPALSNKSIMTGDASSNQMSMGMQNENSSSGFFSDGVDKCD